MKKTKITVSQSLALLICLVMTDGKSRDRKWIDGWFIYLLTVICKAIYSEAIIIYEPQSSEKQAVRSSKNDYVTQSHGALHAPLVLLLFENWTKTRTLD